MRFKIYITAIGIMCLFLINGVNVMANSTLTPDLVNSDKKLPIYVPQNGSTEIQFKNAININGVYIDYREYNNSPNVNGSMVFYDGSGTSLGSIGFGPGSINGHLDKIVFNYKNIKKIKLNAGSVNGYNVTSFNISVFDIYVDVQNLLAKPSYNSVSLTWSSLASNLELDYFKIYRNNVFLTNLNRSAIGYDDSNLESDTEYEYKVVAVYKDGKESIGVSTKVNTLIKPKNVTNLKATSNGTTIKLSYSPPGDATFTGVKIYRDERLIKTLSKTEITFLDTGLDYATNYTYKITSVYIDGFETTGVSVSAKTGDPPKPPNDLNSISSKAEWNSVVLNWNLPSDKTNLAKIFVYRNGTKIAELNGDQTTFTDNKVNPLTSYQYTLKTVSDIFLESTGVSITVKTPEEPIPEVVDSGFEKLENGDYLFKWKEPTDGKVKVLIDGKEYKTVDAKLLEILIPTKDMKYDMLNNPKVSLVPISESGKEGKPEIPKPIDPESGGTTFPFTVDELVKTGFNLLWFIGPILLLALSFLLFPKFRNLIFGAFRKDGGQALQGGKDDRTDRERVNPVRKEHQEKREQHVGKEYLAKLEKNSEKVIAVSRAPRIPRDKNYRPIRESRMPRMPRETRPGREPRAGRER